MPNSLSVGSVTAPEHISLFVLLPALGRAVCAVGNTVPSTWEAPEWGSATLGPGGQQIPATPHQTRAQDHDQRMLQNAYISALKYSKDTRFWDIWWPIISIKWWNCIAGIQEGRGWRTRANKSKEKCSFFIFLFLRFVCRQFSSFSLFIWINVSHEVKKSMCFLELQVK